MQQQEKRISKKKDNDSSHHATDTLKKVKTFLRRVKDEKDEKNLTTESFEQNEFSENRQVSLLDVSIEEKEKLALLYPPLAQTHEIPIANTLFSGTISTLLDNNNENSSLFEKKEDFSPSAPLMDKDDICEDYTLPFPNNIKPLSDLVYVPPKEIDGKENYGNQEKGRKKVLLIFLDKLPVDHIYLDGRVSALVYKIVEFKVGKKVVCEALLHMQISLSKASIFTNSNCRVHPAKNGLVNGKKYCTNRAFVLGAQLLCQSPKKFRIALNHFQRGEGKFISFHDSSFEYCIGHSVREYKAGFGNHTCGPGIWFFPNYSSALEYGNINFNLKMKLALGEKPTNIRIDIPFLSKTYYRQIECVESENKLMLESNKKKKKKILKVYFGDDIVLDDNELEPLPENNFGENWNKENYIEKSLAKWYPEYNSAFLKKIKMNIGK